MSSKDSTSSDSQAIPSMETLCPADGDAASGAHTPGRDSDPAPASLFMDQGDRPGETVEKVNRDTPMAENAFFSPHASGTGATPETEAIPPLAGRDDAAPGAGTPASPENLRNDAPPGPEAGADRAAPFSAPEAFPTGEAERAGHAPAEESHVPPPLIDADLFDEDAGSDEAPRTASPGASGETVPGDGFSRPARPLVTVPPSMPIGLSTRIFNALAYAPWLVLALLVAAQTIGSLEARDLWYSDEIRHADVFRNFLANDRWFVLELNGAPYPDKPPLYFWFLRGLHHWLQTDGPLLFFVAAAISGLLYVWAALLLGRVVARADGRTLLAGGIVLLCSGYVTGLLHYARMDFLFASLILCSHVALFLAFTRAAPLLWSVAGCLLGAAACLVKGPLGLALPLATCLLFAVWRASRGRGAGRAAAAGLLAALLVLGAWAAGVFLETGSHEFLVNDILGRQVLDRAIDTFHHKEPWHYYLLRLPLMVLPWTILVFCLPWTGLFKKAVWRNVAVSRRPEGEGTAFLWCMALSALVLLSCLSGKLLIYYLPALPALALLMGRAVLRLAGARAVLFRILFALVLVAAGTGFVAASLALFGSLPLPEIKGLPAWQLPVQPAFVITGLGIVVLGLFYAVCLRSSRPEAILLTFALAMTALTYPLATMVAPAFDRVLSPRAQADVMRDYAQAGYAPLSYRDYGGTYAYYLGRPVEEITSLEGIGDRLTREPVVLAIKRRDLAAWTDRPGCLQPVHSQYIENSERVLLACPAPDAATVNAGEGRPAAEPAPADDALPLPPPAPEVAPAPPASPSHAPVPAASTVRQTHDAPASPTEETPSESGLEALPQEAADFPAAAPETSPDTESRAMPETLSSDPEGERTTPAPEPAPSDTGPEARRVQSLPVAAQQPAQGAFALP